MVLLLFIFSITPKKYLHDLIADHVDAVFARGADAPAIKKAEFNCHYDHLVTESPFTPLENIHSKLLLIHGTTVVIPLYEDVSLGSKKLKENKGPPAFVA
jgi:hypothetical protein